MIVWDADKWIEIVPETHFEGTWMESNFNDGKQLAEVELRRTPHTDKGESPVYLRLRKRRWKGEDAD